jgi:DNA-binding LytR/AlgR family response regulator
MKVLIIEDEKPAADKLKRMLTENVDDIVILDTLETVESSVNWFLNNPAPDLIFMDIQLNDGISFEIFDSVKISAPIIFITAYDEYAIRAFKVNSIDYLLKPIEVSALVTSIEKFRTLYPAGKTDDKKIDILYNQLVKKYKTRFFIKFGSHCRSVMTEDIKYFFIVERSTFMKTFPGKIFDVDYSLDQLEKMLDPENFFRINRKFIINLAAITDIITWSSSRLKIKMADEEENHDMVVSREKVSEFKKLLDQ